MRKSARRDATRKREGRNGKKDGVQQRTSWNLAIENNKFWNESSAKSSVVARGKEGGRREEAVARWW